MPEKPFSDLNQVHAWLEQFKKPDVAASTDEATVQMVALMGQALQKVVEELMRLRQTDRE
jgi:hypothetical protein